jgi:hypothetical protein
MGKLEIDKDSVLLNPFERAPLSALVHFTLPHARRIRISVQGRDHGPDLVHLFPEAQQQHSIPVHGLYADHNNQVTISVVDKLGTIRSSETLSIQTQALGTIISGSMSVVTHVYPDASAPHFFLVQNAIYDDRGYVRWYTTYIGNKYFKLSDQLIAEQIYNDKGEPAPVVEDIRIIDLLGREVALYDVPHRNHHEVIEKTPGGNLLVGTNAAPYLSIDDDTEDAIVELDRQSGEVVKFWDLRDIFDPERERIWMEMPNDWCHLNSIQYDSTDNSLLISSKLQSFISKIDYETGRIRWIFGNHHNWGAAWQAYLLEPLNFDTSIHPDRDWTYAQHMTRLTPEGHIIVYDNGKPRPGGDFTRIHEFRVDSLQKIVESVWTHDFDFATKTMGSVQVLASDHVLAGHGEKGRIMVISRDGTTIFEARMRTFYRAYPFELYPK